MSAKPVHPLNPCRWGDAAKLWELLRRNTRFERWVRALNKREERLDKPPGENLLRIRRSIEFVSRINPCAAVAASWFFSPSVHHARRKYRDASELDPQEVEFWKREYGWRPDLAPEAAKDIERRVINLLSYIPSTRGAPMRAGPFMNAADAARVESWDKQHGKFSLELPWSSTPPLFRDRFAGLWGTVDPGKEAFLPSIAPRETDFFHSWRLMELVNRFGRTVKFGNQLLADGGASDEVAATKFGIIRHSSRLVSPTSDDFTRALSFDRIQQNYRVFLFPKNLLRLSTGAIRDTFKQWADQLIKEMDTSKADIFGSVTEWDVFLFAGQCNERRLKEAYRTIESRVKPSDRNKKWRKQRLNYVSHFRELERQIASVFPRCQ